MSPMDAIKTGQTRTENGHRPDCGQDNSGRPQKPHTWRSTNATDTPVKNKCTRCGKGPHPAGGKCPASTATCHRCKRKGHFQSQCFTKSAVQTDELSVSTAFLGAVGDKHISPWQISALVGDKLVVFKLDTGAQVMAISERTYAELQPGPLKKPSIVLYGPAGKTLDVIGQFTVKITVGSRFSKQRAFKDTSLGCQPSQP